MQQAAGTHRLPQAPPCGAPSGLIYKSLFLSKFFVRVTARSKTMIFKPTTPLDGEKSSLWISNFWAKSFLPFDLYHEKSCKNGEISTRPQLIILLKTRNIFFSGSPTIAEKHLLTYSNLNV